MEKELQSYHNRHYWYAVDGVLDIEPKTIYKGSCIKDYSYGFTEDLIWCRAGCRANFVLTVKVPSVAI